MPTYDVRYTGPNDFVIEADSQDEAEREAHDSVEDCYIADERGEE